MIRREWGGTVKHHYLHRDHLGSITAVTDETDGSIVERYSYDAWGKRRIATNWQASDITTTLNYRGYTGHEHLDDVGIIHMNGRLYSPKLGRMLSPDPVTQAPENGQNYNRYSYVFNNPLKFTDPSGYCTAMFGFDEDVLTCPRKSNEDGFWEFWMRMEYPDSYGYYFDLPPPSNAVGDNEKTASEEYLENAKKDIESFVDKYRDQLSNVLGGRFDEFSSDLMSYLSDNIEGILAGGKTYGGIAEGSAAFGFGGVGGLVFAFDKGGYSVFGFAGFIAGASSGFGGTLGLFEYDGQRSGLLGFGAAINLTLAVGFSGWESEFMFAGGVAAPYGGLAAGYPYNFGISVELTYTWELSDGEEGIGQPDIAKHYAMR